MRRIIPLLLLLLAPSAWGAIGHTACPTGCTNSNTSSSSLTLPSSGTNNWTTGDFLVVGIRTGVTGITVNTPTDTTGNTFHCRASVAVSTSALVTMCYAFNITGGADTITVTTNSATNLHIVVDQYNGVATSCDPVEGAQVSGTVTGGTSITTSSLTITNATGLVASLGASVNNNPTAGTNFILRASVSNGRASNEDRLGVTAGSFTASITLGTSGDGVLVMSAITPTGSCPSTGKPPGQFPRVQ